MSYDFFEKPEDDLDPQVRKKQKLPKSKKVKKVKKTKPKTPKKLVGDKSLSKNEIINYICKTLRQKKKKYNLDYLRALKYNLDAIDIAK